MEIKTLEWKKGKLFLLDQTQLPLREIYVPCSTPLEVAAAIRTLMVRGAPAIGVAAAFAMVLGAGRRNLGISKPLTANSHNSKMPTIDPAE